jgi:hypothetical protein
MSLAFQGVQTGDTLIVYQSNLSTEPSVHTTTFEAKVHSILREILKINDACHHSFDTNPRSSQTYRNLLDAHPTDPWDELCFPPDYTGIGTPKLGTTPLPMLAPELSDEEEDSDESNFPGFESIEEAAKSLAENPRTEWIW